MTDRLQAGERLNFGDKLVSKNGVYTLWMQPDANLVLYHDAVSVNTAYWATNTEWLPADQRPIDVEMQVDGHLVMYDVNHVARWGSGTWGNFGDPYLILQDDGNLVIYDKSGQPVWASGSVGGAGAIPARGYVPNPGLNFAVDACGRMPAVVQGSTDLGPPTSHIIDSNGVAYTLTEQRRRLVNDVIEHAFLQDIAGLGVWPGQVIQGKELLVGDIAPVGPLARQPGTVEVVTDIISGNPHKQSAVVDHPDAAAVNQARREILLALKPADSPGLLKVDMQKASTLREVGVKAGLSIKGSAFGVDANATLDETHRQSTVVASIRQIFYNVTFTPEGPQTDGIWRTPDVSTDNLKPYIGPGNPPLYVDSVQYGRFICVTAQAGYSSSEITAALKFHWTATVSGTGNLDVRTKEILDSSSVKIYTLGVPGHAQFQSLADPVKELEQVYKSGLSLTPDNPGVPISFTCRHIADGTLGHVGLAAEYTQPLSAVGQDISDAQFEVFDGPGGGLVDTHIVVNPGDKMTLHAEGAIWTGVIFSGDTGPEGWPGHNADPGAPMPSGTAYCLVARCGNGDWFEAAAFWEGSPQPGQGGTLQLETNDNNPYNGDPNKRWTVHVDVKRANAAAAGIFI